MAKQIDSGLLALAAHELGHAKVFKALGGFEVKTITVNTTRGDTWIDFDETNDALWEPFAIGLWAGLEAQDRWMRRHGHGRAPRSCTVYDVEQFRTIPRKFRISEGKARSKARSLVAQNWGCIERLAPQLASTGRLSGSQV